MTPNTPTSAQNLAVLPPACRTMVKALGPTSQALTCPCQTLLTTFPACSPNTPLYFPTYLQTFPQVVPLCLPGMPFSWHQFCQWYTHANIHTHTHALTHELWWGAWHGVTNAHSGSLVEETHQSHSYLGVSVKEGST